MDKHSRFLSMGNYRACYGIMEHKNGDKYEGHWVNGMKDGYGKETLSDGSSYEGQWVNGLSHGYGKEVLMDGTTYEGRWNNGQKEGFGIEVRCDGTIYEGKWANGEKQGAGKLYYSKGFFFVGNWDKGTRTQKWNLFRYEYRGWPVFLLALVTAFVSGWWYLYRQPIINNSIVYQRYSEGWYSGDLHNNVREGTGAYLWNNGDFYQGGWMGDQMTGQGMYAVGDSVVYIGEFRENQFVAGKVIDKREKNEVFVGRFEHDKRSGLGIYINSHDSVYFGNWTDNTLHGLLYSSNGSYYQGLFVDFEPISGQMVQILPSESLYIGSFHDLRREGQGLALSFSSPLDLYIGNWSQGQQTGVGILVSDMSLAYGEFSNGEIVSGTQITTESEANFNYSTLVDSQKSGFGVEKEGKSVYIGSYHQGQRSGQGLQVFESGQYLIGTFAHDKLDSGHGLVLSALNKLWYYGGITDGGFSGHGIQWNTTGCVYNGEWKAGRKDGKGVEISANYDIRVGTFREGEMTYGSVFRRNKPGGILLGTGVDNGGFTGAGVIYDEQQGKSLYIGEITDDRPDGEGVLVRPLSLLQKGEFYAGELQAGVEFRVNTSGEVHFAEIHDKDRSGLGVSLFPNGTVVTGAWSGGKRKGLGLMLNLTGEHSSGDFEGDVLVSGTTLQSLPNGDYYYGQSANGQFHGKGTRFHPSPYHSEFSLYMGEWQNGQEFGRGTKVTPESEVKVGFFVEGNMTLGMDLNYFSNGDLYYGKKRDGKREGWGCYVWSEGTVYIGEWKQGEMSGDGRLIKRSGEYQEGRFDRDVLSSGFTFQSTPRGDLYLGKVENSVFSGKGTLLTLSTGSASLNAYSGDWVDGEPYGAGLSLSTSVNVTRGQFQRQGFWSGKALYKYPNQDMYYGEIDYGMREGFGIYIWKDGTMYSGNWANDIPQGQGTKITTGGNVCIGEIYANEFISGKPLTMIAEKLQFSVLLVLLWVGA